MLTLAIALSASMEGRLDLVCLGRGSANKPTSSTAYITDNYGNSATANVTGNRTVPFADQVNLWVEGSDGRIRMPQSMLPLLRGGEGGWFKLKNLEVSENEITGSVAVNVINNPKLVVDRRTGFIRLSGKAGNYLGECQRFTPSDMPQKF